MCIWGWVVHGDCTCWYVCDRWEDGMCMKIARQNAELKLHHKEHDDYKKCWKLYCKQSLWIISKNVVNKLDYMDYHDHNMLIVWQVTIYAHKYFDRISKQSVVS